MGVRAGTRVAHAPRRLGRCDDAESAEWVESIDAAPQASLCGVSGLDVSDAPHGAACERSRAHGGGGGSRRDCDRIFLPGARATFCASPSGGHLARLAALVFGQRARHSPPAGVMPAPPIEALFVNSGLLGQRTFARFVDRAFDHDPEIRARQVVLTDDLTPIDRIIRRVLCMRLAPNGSSPLRNADLFRYRAELNAGLLARRRIAKLER